MTRQDTQNSTQTCPVAAIDRQIEALREPGTPINPDEHDQAEIALREAQTYLVASSKAGIQAQLAALALAIGAGDLVKAARLEGLIDAGAEALPVA